MKKERQKFRMKRFEVGDSRSGCRIGVDGTLIGSWAPVGRSTRRVLDAGCGCGLIALMLAQRLEGREDSEVTGIDIDGGAVADARENVQASPFADKIEILPIGIEEVMERGEKYDLVVSNPPFFESGGNPAESSRMLARHAGTLSPEILIENGRELLSSEGRLAFIGPAEYVRRYLRLAAEYGLYAERVCFVKGHPGAPCKRVMLSLRLHSLNKESLDKDGRPNEDKRDALPDCAGQCATEHLNIKDERGEFTPEYMALGKDFYLKF